MIKMTPKSDVVNCHVSIRVKVQSNVDRILSFKKNQLTWPHFGWITYSFATTKKMLKTP